MSLSASITKEDFVTQSIVGMMRCVPLSSSKESKLFDLFNALYDTCDQLLQNI